MAKLSYLLIVLLVVDIVIGYAAVTQINEDYGTHLSSGESGLGESLYDMNFSTGISEKTSNASKFDALYNGTVASTDESDYYIKESSGVKGLLRLLGNFLLPIGSLLRSTGEGSIMAVSVVIDVVWGLLYALAGLSFLWRWDA